MITAPTETHLSSADMVIEPLKNDPDRSMGLYTLIGPNVPSIVAQLHKPRHKVKEEAQTTEQTKWAWKTFKNSARKDGLQLGHWAKTSSDTDTETDYGFTKYNRHTPEHHFTSEEYSRLLEDPEWTKDETDYLFKIVREYDQRWYVIIDRYNYIGGRPRTVEDLKERFCHVCRKLIKDRILDQETRSKALAPYGFDKERELTRKRYLANLESRSAREIEEEEALFLEIKRMEQNERRFKRDREELLRTLAGIESGLPDVVEDELPLILFDTSKKRKRMDTDSPVTAVPTSANISAPSNKRTIPHNPKIPPEDPIQCIRHIELSLTTPATKAAHQPSYLRTFKLPSPKPAVLPRVTTALKEVDMQHIRLVMPTEKNIALLTALVEAATQDAEVQKAREKVEGELQALKEKHGITEESVDPELGSEEGMDDLGRARSVSTSTRSRKRGRSMSVSSVDTSASRTGGPPKKKR